MKVFIQPIRYSTLLVSLFLATSPLHAIPLPADTKPEIIGIAEIVPNKVVCWDKNGKLLPDLAKQVAAYCSIHVQNNFSYSVQMKTRYVIVKSSNTKWFVEGTTNADIKDLDFMSATSSFGLSKLKVDPNLKQATIIARVYNSKPKMGTIACEPGQSATIADATYRVIYIEPFERPVDKRSFQMLDSLSKGKHWQIGVDISTINDNRLTYGYSPLDIDKKTIQYVDRDGTPVSADTYLTDPVKESSGMSPRAEGKYAQAYTWWWRDKQGKSLIITNVNPKYLRFIGLSFYDTIDVPFTNIALDPK